MNPGAVGPFQKAATFDPQTRPSRDNPAGLRGGRGGVPGLCAGQGEVHLALHREVLGRGGLRIARVSCAMLAMAEEAQMGR